MSVGSQGAVAAVLAPPMGATDVPILGRDPVTPDVSIVLLTWNSARHIEACLDSLPDAVAPFALEVVVVDNGSTDGTPERVERLRPGTRVVRNRSNRGVAAGRNQGLALARGRVLVLLDVDTVAAPGSLRRLVEHLREHPAVGLCGPRLLLPDGSVQPSCQRFPTVFDKLLRVLPRRLAARGLRGVEMRDLDHLRTLAVDYVVGACQVIRREALVEVGWLDERMFYGPEDVDFCARLGVRGWRVDFVGDAVVRHECQRVTRWRLNGLAVRHGIALLRYFRAHGTLWSRSRLARQIAEARVARFPDSPPPERRATDGKPDDPSGSSSREAGCVAES